MTDIWKCRHSNWNKTASILENFGFVLNESNLKKSKKDTSERDFKEKISKLEKTTSPKFGDIVTIETRENPSTIKYAGIYISNNQILNQEYGIKKINTPEELIIKYSKFHKDIFENEGVKISHYKTQEKL